MPLTFVLIPEAKITDNLLEDPPGGSGGEGSGDEDARRKDSDVPNDYEDDCAVLLRERSRRQDRDSETETETEIETEIETETERQRQR